MDMYIVCALNQLKLEEGLRTRCDPHTCIFSFYKRVSSCTPGKHALSVARLYLFTAEAPKTVLQANSVFLPKHRNRCFLRAAKRYVRPDTVRLGHVRSRLTVRVLL